MIFGIRQRLVTEGNAALLQLVREVKLVKDLELRCGFELCPLTLLERNQPFIKSWKRHLG